MATRCATKSEPATYLYLLPPPVIMSTLFQHRGKSSTALPRVTQHCTESISNLLMSYQHSSLTAHFSGWRSLGPSRALSRFPYSLFLRISLGQLLIQPSPYNRYGTHPPSIPSIPQLYSSTLYPLPSRLPTPLRSYKVQHQAPCLPPASQKSNPIRRNLDRPPAPARAALVLT